jgi:hypothetical protein
MSFVLLNSIAAVSVYTIKGHFNKTDPKAFVFEKSFTVLQILSIFLCEQNTAFHPLSLFLIKVVSKQSQFVFTKEFKHNSVSETLRFSVQSKSFHELRAFHTNVHFI